MQQLRCSCTKHPLLALVGRNKDTGAPFVHVKVYKQSRIFSELVVEGGPIRIRCRECNRWSVIHMRVERADIVRAPLPPALELAT